MKGFVQKIEGLATRDDVFRKVLYRVDAGADMEHFDGKTSEESIGPLQFSGPSC